MIIVMREVGTENAETLKVDFIIAELKPEWNKRDLVKLEKGKWQWQSMDNFSNFRHKTVTVEMQLKIPWKINLKDILMQSSHQMGKELPDFNDLLN